MPTPGTMKFMGLRPFRDGSTISAVWIWWHPVAWVLAPLSAVLAILMNGVPDFWRYRHENGFGLSPYWKARRNEIKWL